MNMKRWKLKFDDLFEKVDKWIYGDEFDEDKMIKEIDYKWLDGFSKSFRIKLVGWIKLI